MTIVLADLGGTHLRLARLGQPDVAKFKITDYAAIESVLRDFAPEIEALYLAAAIHPRGGVIEDCRFSDTSHWRIDLAELETALGLKRLSVLNDLEAACYGLSKLTGVDLETILRPTADTPHLEHPPSLLVGIGTGIGHAFMLQKPGHAPFVQRSHGGHMPALSLTAEQAAIVEKLGAKKTGRDLVVEDIVSGTGYAALLSLTDEDTALRLFWEFLGLYCNMLVSVTGAYGGVYLTGGVMDEMFAVGKVDGPAFARNFIPRMVPVVVESLSSTPVYYVREKNLPIVGLSMFAENNA